MNATKIMKEQVEKYEEKLENFALKSTFAKGKKEYDDPSYLRYHIDYMRIVNSFAFRRLRGKTQVFGPAKYDPPRCRLTHTLEVAEASRTVAKILNVNEDATVAIALGHDLGHPPFGHSGERALDKILKELVQIRKVPMIGGFRHNWQSLRVVDTHEVRLNFCGFNLSHDVREGILKHYKHYENDPATDPRYPDITDDDEEKLYLKFPKSSSVEGQIVYYVDKIISAIHDIEDAYKLGVITWKDLSNEDSSTTPPLFGKTLEEVLFKKIGQGKNEILYPMHEKFRNSTGRPWPGEKTDKVRDACTRLRIYLMGSLIEGTKNNLSQLKFENATAFYNRGRQEIASKKDETSEKLDQRPSEFKFPDTLKNKISYHASQKRLIFKGIMSKEEKGELVKLSPNDSLYKNAIEALFLMSQEGVVTFKCYQDMKAFKGLKDWIDNSMINSDLINEADARAEGIIKRLYQAYLERPLLLPIHILMRYELYIKEHVEEVHRPTDEETKHFQKVGMHAHCEHFKQKELRNKKLETKLIQELQNDPIFCRIIADYIAGMTDRFAVKKARELY